MCTINYATKAHTVHVVLDSETVMHFFLDCPNYNHEREYLTSSLIRIAHDLSRNNIVHLFLYGHERPTVNSIIIEAISTFVLSIHRFKYQ